MFVKEARSSGAVSKSLPDAEATQAHLNQEFSDVQVSDEDAKLFFEANKEDFHHVGFFPERDVLKKIARLGVE